MHASSTSTLIRHRRPCNVCPIYRVDKIRRRSLVGLFCIGTYAIAGKSLFASLHALVFYLMRMKSLDGIDFTLACSNIALVSTWPARQRAWMPLRLKSMSLV
jgi:hypothetical protein